MILLHLILGFLHRLVTNTSYLVYGLTAHNRFIKRVFCWRSAVGLCSLLPFDLEGVERSRLRLIILRLVTAWRSHGFLARLIIHAHKHFRLRVLNVHGLVNESIAVSDAILNGLGRFAVTALFVPLRELKGLCEKKLWNMVFALLVTRLLQIAAVLNRPLASHGWQAMETMLLGHNQLLFERVCVTVFVEPREISASNIAIYSAAKVWCLVPLRPRGHDAQLDAVAVAQHAL